MYVIMEVGIFVIHLCVYNHFLLSLSQETQQLVAVKKFLETDEDKMVKKIAMREVRMLKVC